MLAFVWGSSFILMKVALFDSNGNPVYTDFQVAALRIAIAGLALLPLAIPKIKTIKRKSWIWILGIGVLGNLFPAYLFTSAQTQLPSGITGMLNSLTPLFTMLVGVLLFKTEFTQRQLIGLGVGFIGAIVLIVSGGGLSEMNEGIHWGACGRVALATLFYGCSVNILKNKLEGIGPTAIASIALMLVMPIGLVALYFSDAANVALTHESGLYSLGAVGILALVGTAGALVLFNSLIKWTDALTASSVTYVIPVFAALWGWIDGEILTLGHLSGGVIILIGVALVKRL